MRKLEPLVCHVPERTDRRKCEVCLREQRHHARPVEKRSVPALVQAADLAIVDDERKRVQERAHEKGVRDPPVEDLQFLVADPCDEGDEVALPCRCKHKWQTRESEPAGPCRKWW